MLIDLHVHSTASDGTDTPTEVIEVAAQAGVDVVALTDHDSAAGWSDAAKAARRLGITLLPGAEISCQFDGIGVHLLAYLYDPENAALLAETTRTRRDRLDRAQRMVQRMSRDLDITWADVLEHVGPAATVGRPHLADALVAMGVVASRDEAFATLLHARSPYYLPHYSPDAELVVRLVLAAGGVPVMAHPRAGKRGRIVSLDAIAELADAGLVGLEVDHRDNAEEDRRILRDLARDLDLLTTGSSDYHGTGKQNRIAENTTTPEVLEQIIELGTADRVVRP
ncbi:MAG TPA: PHP domain-containing protein [Kineosporiaceae bacterium]|nr:PHP domain-containing protein [Kineosporiaceae bacterium]